MNRMYLIAGILAAAATVTHAQQHLAPTSATLRFASPTYYADGRVGGAAAWGRGWAFTTDQPVVAYVYSGKTLCMSASADHDRPDDAGYGWMVTVQRRPAPAADADGREIVGLRVEWQKLWDAGVAIRNGAKGARDLELHPGDRITLDYLGAPSAMSGDCNAVGMGLEIGLDSPDLNKIVETDLWLVRTAADGTEESQHQMVRATAKSPTPYAFTDVKTPLAFAVFSKQDATPRTTSIDATMSFRGSVTLISASPERVTLELTIVRTGPLRTDPFRAELMAPVATASAPKASTTIADIDATERTGSTTYKVSLKPGEVVSLKLPGIAFHQLANQPAPTPDQFSIRIRVKGPQ